MDFVNNKDLMVFHTYLPVQLDATCNGYQHLALLTQETKLLSKLNLGKSTYDEDPDDYYSYVANLNREFIKSSIEKIPVELEDNLKILRNLDKDLDKISIVNSYTRLIDKVDNMLVQDKYIYNQTEPLLKKPESKPLKNILSKSKPLKNSLTIETDLFLEEIEKENKKLEPKLLNNLLTKVEKQLSELNSLKKLDALDLGRPIIKKVLMRHSYSAGLPTLVNNVLTDESIIQLEKTDDKMYYKHVNSDLIFSRYDIAIYVKSLTTLIRILSPKIDMLSKYLSNIVSICTRLGIPIPWLLPSGANIAGSYLVEEEHKIAAFTFTKAKYTFKVYVPGQYDIKKQKRAIRPNLVHSLDACTIAMLYSNLKKDLYTVHDCFAVTADNIPLLMYKLKMVYIRLYSTNTYLLDFDNTVRFNINKSYGDKVFKVEDNYINMPGRDKSELFPNVNEIINLYDNDKKIDNLKESSNILI